MKYLVSFVLAAFVFACATKKEDNHEQAGAEQAEWKEMDDFHMIMAETFHPYKDSANLEPAKTRASELAAAAEKWSGSPLPEKVNNDEMKKKLNDLREGSLSLVEKVSAGDDAAIGDQLNKVHDLFHTIQEDWYGGGHHHNH
jgi:hypothetical protein